MKNIFKVIADIFYSLGKARAAGTFVRLGRPDMAKKILAND